MKSRNVYEFVALSLPLKYVWVCCKHSNVDQLLNKYVAILLRFIYVLKFLSIFRWLCYRYLFVVYLIRLNGEVTQSCIGKIPKSVEVKHFMQCRNKALIACCDKNFLITFENRTKTLVVSWKQCCKYDTCSALLLCVFVSSTKVQRRDEHQSCVKERWHTSLIVPQEV